MRNLLTMIALAASTVSVGAAQAQTTSAQGDPMKGRGLYSGAPGGALCMLCHGPQGQGGFGPDVAGARGLTFEQFKREVQNPWGIMPSFGRISDQSLSDIYAFLKGLAPASQPAQWSVELPPSGAPRGQIMAVTFGCAQCHGPEMGHPRRDLGARSADFTEFQAIVYDHAPATMGQFSRERMSEPVLKEVWDFMMGMGLRAPLFGSIAPGVASGANTTYTLTIDNRGVPGKGLPASDATVSLVVPAGVLVASTTGPGYQGTQAAEYVANPNALAPFKALNPSPNVQRVKGTIATWKLPKLAAGEKQTVTIALSGPGAGTVNFAGSTVTWGKPDVKRLPNVTVKDLRLADKGDIIYAPSQEFSLPPAPRATAQQGHPQD
ncbi:MAG TPA: c-type cytochrome [Vicinamibacterales bacterium]|nr:c-type cytochrome [Vicinamibacterales bacterium]